MKKITNIMNNTVKSTDNELLLDNKIIVSQKDKLAWLEGEPKWVQNYSSLLWKNLLEPSLEKDHYGKVNFDLIVEDVAIFLQDIKN